MTPALAQARSVAVDHTLFGQLGYRLTEALLDFDGDGHLHVLGGGDCAPSDPRVYPGSIERIDFGEAKEKKGFVLAEVSKGKTEWQFVPLKTRRFLDFTPKDMEADTFMSDILSQLPDPEQLKDAICRVQLRYPRDWEPLLDENAIIDHFKEALSIQILKHRETEKRSRLGDTLAVESLSPEALLAKYWDTVGLEGDEAKAMQSLAKDVLGEMMG